MQCRRPKKNSAILSQTTAAAKLVKIQDLLADYQGFGYYKSSNSDLKFLTITVLAKLDNDLFNNKDI